jgi:hypothetical protein
LQAQRDRLALLRAEQRLIGADPAAMRQGLEDLAGMAERQRLEAQSPGLSDTAAGREAIANARTIARGDEETRRIKEQEAIGREVGSAFFDAVRGGLLDGKSWKEVRQGLAAQVGQIASRELLEKPLQQLFGQLFASAFGTGSAGGGSGAGWFAGLASSVGGWFGGGGGADALPAVTAVVHDGGVVSRSAWGGASRSVPSSVFGEAPRYHGGGRAGMPPWIGPRELPAILEEGELVLNRRQQAAVRERLAGGGGRTVVMPVHQTIVAPSPGHYRAAQATIGAGLHRQMQRLARHV